MNDPDINLLDKAIVNMTIQEEYIPMTRDYASDIQRALDKIKQYNHEIDKVSAAGSNMTASDIEKIIHRREMRKDQYLDLGELIFEALDNGFDLASIAQKSQEHTS